MAALALWQIAASAAGVKFIFPAPSDVLSRLFALIRTPEFFTAVGNSFIKIVSGFLLGLVSGLILAVAAARYRIVEDILWPFMITIKSVPVASFVVLALMWMTSRSLSTFISFLMVLPIIYTNILGGIKAADRGTDKMAALFRMPYRRRLLYIWLPRIKPFLISSCSVALGLSWKSGVAAELIGVPSGSLGEHLYYSKLYFNTPDLFAWTLVIVLISIGFEKLFLALLKFFYGRLEKI